MNRILAVALVSLVASASFAEDHFQDSPVDVGDAAKIASQIKKTKRKAETRHRAEAKKLASAPPPPDNSSPIEWSAMNQAYEHAQALGSCDDLTGEWRLVAISETEKYNGKGLVDPKGKSGISFNFFNTPKTPLAGTGCYFSWLKKDGVTRDKDVADLTVDGKTAAKDIPASVSYTEETPYFTCTAYDNGRPYGTTCMGDNIMVPHRKPEAWQEFRLEDRDHLTYQYRFDDGAHASYLGFVRIIPEPEQPVP